MEEKDLFQIEGENKELIIGSEGQYFGHTILCGRYNHHIKIFERYFNSLLDNPIKEVVEKFFFETLERKYLEAQQSLADKFLRGKIVSVSDGIVIGHADPNEMYVYWSGCPSWYEIEKNPGTILVLSYGDDCIARILINAKTEIKIVGKIPNTKYP